MLTATDCVGYVELQIWNGLTGEYHVYGQFDTVADAKDTLSQLNPERAQIVTFNCVEYKQRG